MNCTTQSTHFHRFIKNELPENEKLAYQAHIKNCELCQQATIEHANYIEAMANFNAPSISDEKMAEMFNIATAQDKPAASSVTSSSVTSSSVMSSSANQGNKNDKPQNFLTGFLAASVLFIGLLTTWQLTLSNTQQTPVAHIIDDYFTTDVTLTINVPEDMIDADLNLILPENVALQGFEGESELSWYVDLKKGSNTLSLPIEVEAGSDLNQSLSFIAEIEYNNKQKDFELKVNLLAPKNQA